MTQKTASLNKRPKTAARTKNRLAACLRRLMPIVCLVGIAVAYTLHTGKPVWTLFPHRDTGKLLEEARSGNNAQAQFTLGRMYYKGDGVPRDLHEAARWFHKAAEQGHAPAEEALRRQDIRQAHKDNIAAEFEELARPRREALLRRAQEGDAEARYELGEAYSSGELGLPEDEAQAIIWYRRAGEQDHVAAQRALAKRYQDGIGVPKDTAEALKWYRRAGELGDEISREKLAHMYRTGDGVPRDMQQALVWYRKLAEGGSLNSMEEIAKIYAAGDGVPRDMQQALVWYRKLAYRDPHSGSPEEIARIYDKGDGVPRDKLLAAAWYQRISTMDYRLEEKVRKALQALKADGRLLEDWKDVIESVQTARVAVARFELFRDGDKTGKTGQGREKFAWQCHDAERICSGFLEETWQNLKKAGNNVPQPIKDMAAAASLEAEKVCHAAKAAGSAEQPAEAQPQ